ncbi:MAG: hypothetical protein R3F37_14685 [Candidatus Competibacteraceae bacterium]
MKRKLAVGLLLAALLPIVGIRLYQQILPVEFVPYYKYGMGHGPEAVESQRIGLDFSQHLDPHDCLSMGWRNRGSIFGLTGSTPIGTTGVPGLFMGNPPDDSSEERYSNWYCKNLKTCNLD